MIARLTARLAPIATLCLPFPAAAQALGVIPTVIEVPAARSSAAMEVRNRSDRPVAVELRLYAWSQVDGADRLSEVPGLAVSPPTAIIHAGSVQTFRILLPRGARAGEQSYRVILDQLPDNSTPAPGGMGVRLRLSMPIFAAGSGREEARIQWTSEKGRLIAANVGSKRLRFSGLSVSDGRSPKVLPLGTTPYLLPGTTRFWPLSAGGGPLHVTGGSDVGAVDAIIPAP